MMMPLVDPFGREISYIRISVTDRCDFRCVYCMSEDMTFLPKKDLLTLEELDRLTSAFVRLGTRKVRITGGEPLVRKGVMQLFRSLGRHLHGGGLDELTVTTNGSQLARHAGALHEAGVRRINVSLDTLDPEKFRAITRWGRWDRVMEGIAAATQAGLAIKINAVAMKGVNEDEFDRMIRWCGERGFDLTLIETMPMGDIDGDRTEQYLPPVGCQGRSRQAVDAHRQRSPDRRSGTLCAHCRDWRTPRLHHADDPQLLRILQPGPVDVHRHPLHVPWPGRLRGPEDTHAHVSR